MTELQLNSRGAILDTMANFASEKLQTSYQNSVPFVNVTLELFERWCSEFRFKKNRYWFRVVFSDLEWEALLDFENMVKKVEKTLDEKGYPTTDVFLETKEGRVILEAAQQSIKRFPYEERKKYFW